MGAFSGSAYSAIAFSVDSSSTTSLSTRTNTSVTSRRKETLQRVVLNDGTAITVRVLDGLLIDDLLVSGMKAEGYRVMTGRDVFPTVDRRLKDYLIKTGVIQE
jgi:hypothetical protein